MNTNVLGTAFRLFVARESVGHDSDEFLCIHHIGLGGGTRTNLVIDTGVCDDGDVETSVIKRHRLGRFVHLFSKNIHYGLGECTWDGNSYTNVIVSTTWDTMGKIQINSLGLRFLARHLVTFDFPNETMYLKRTSIGPLMEVKDEP